MHRIGQMKLAANVVVFGAGPVGLLTAAVAKGLGARKVVIVGASGFSQAYEMPC